MLIGRYPVKFYTSESQKVRGEVKVDDPKCWCRTRCSHTKTAKTKQVFAIAQTTKRYKTIGVKKFAKAQVKNIIIQKNKLDYKKNLVKNLHMLCKDTRMDV
jgi:hypothetical protein